MKKLILLTLIIIANHAVAQETGTYQSDSIYKANKVKARLWYRGTNQKLTARTFYDREGRLIAFKLEPMMDGAQRTTHYTYDPTGKLIAMIDTIKNGEPIKEQIDKLKAAGIDPNKLMKYDKNRPPVEIARYELVYSGEQLTKITHYNPDGSLFTVDNIEDNGKTEIRDWYTNGKQSEQSTTVFLTKFHKEKFFGWNLRSGHKVKWDYRFKYEFEHGHVKSSVRYDGKVEKETTTFYYDSNGLLIKTQGYTPDVFEYVYY